MPVLPTACCSDDMPNPLQYQQLERSEFCPAKSIEIRIKYASLARRNKPRLVLLARTTPNLELGELLGGEKFESIRSAGKMLLHRAHLAFHC